MQKVIAEYTLGEALTDGVLKIIGGRGRRPIVATAGTFAELPLKELQDIVLRFIDWQVLVEPTLEEEERMFVFEASNGKRVWVIDDGAAITVLYPSEY